MKLKKLKKAVRTLLILTAVLVMFCVFSDIPILDYLIPGKDIPIDEDVISEEITEKYNEIEEKANSLIPPIISEFFEKIKEISDF